MWRAARLVTLLLEEACTSRNSILLRTRLVYIGIGKFRSTKQIAYTVDGTLSEVSGYVSILHMNRLFNFESRRKSGPSFETV